VTAGRALRIREMVKKEFRQLLRDPRTRAIIFVSPIIQLLMFGYAVNTDIRHTSPPPGTSTSRVDRSDRPTS
jgi:hypothetical protein